MSLRSADGAAARGQTAGATAGREPDRGRRPGRARTSWAASRWDCCSVPRTSSHPGASSPTRSATPSTSPSTTTSSPRRGVKVDRPFVGLDNYVTVLTDPAVQQSFANIGVFLVINVPLTVVLSLVLANALNRVIRSSRPSSGSATTSRTSRRASPSSASGCSCSSRTAWSTPCSGRWRPNPSWLVNSWLAMPTVALFVTWKQLGFFILLYLAALQNIPEELYESASVDGGQQVGPVLERHRSRRPAGQRAGDAAGHHHRRQPVHRAVPAHRRRRPGRGLHLAGAS